MPKRISVVFVAATIALLTLLPSPANAAGGGWWLQYLNVASGKCMDVKGSSTSNGAIIQEYSCKNPGTSGAANQQFQLQSSGGHTQIVAAHSGKCVDLANWSTVDGGYAQQWTCSGAANQQWNLIYVSSTPRGVTSYLLQNAYSGKCLNRANSGVALYQTACDSSNTQQVWKQLLGESSCTTCIIADPRRR